MALKLKINDIVETEDACVSSQVESTSFSFTWGINNFPAILEDSIVSPTFERGPNEWKLQVRPFCSMTKDSESSEKSIGVSLVLVNGTPEGPVHGLHQISILDSNRRVIHTMQSSSKNGSKFEKAGPGWGWKEFIPRSTVLDSRQGFLTRDTKKLTFHCQIITAKLKHSAVEIKRPRQQTHQNEIQNSSFKLLAKNISSLLESGNFCDVTLKTESQSFQSSKIILAAHSPVFCAMFKSGMTEASSNVVEINDFPAQIVHEMLKFLYTGSCEALGEHPEDLLSIADKYELTSLKLKCEDAVLQKLNIENAANTLILAHFHSPNLKPKTLNFINRHVRQVKETEGFMMMKKAHPNIFADLYDSLVA